MCRHDEPLSSEARNTLLLERYVPYGCCTPLDELPGVRHQGSQNGTTLHELPHTPGGHGFLPTSLPKEAAQRSRDVVSPGHSRKLQ